MTRSAVALLIALAAASSGCRPARTSATSAAEPREARPPERPCGAEVEALVMQDALGRAERCLPSPSGSELLIEVGDPRVTRSTYRSLLMLRARPDGTSVTSIEALWGSGTARWSPDGKWLAVAGDRQKPADASFHEDQAYLVDAGSLVVTPLAPVEGMAYWLDWSPDSEALLVLAAPSLDVAHGGLRGNAWLLARAERRRHELTSGAHARPGAFSPDGAWVVVPEDVGPRLRIFDRAGRESRTIEVTLPSELAAARLLRALWTHPDRVLLELERDPGRPPEWVEVAVGGA